MTQYIPFQPSAQAPQLFSVVLDGVSQIVQITWNLAGMRWYLNIYDGNTGALVWAVALVPSSQAEPINLVGGVFNASTLIWDYVSNQIVAEP